MAEGGSSIQLEETVVKCQEAFQNFKKVSRYLRHNLLREIGQGIESRRGEFVRAIVSEAKKPKFLAELEVTRAIQTFEIAAEETRRFGGEVIPVDGEVTAQEFGPATSVFVPRGPVLGISPYNFPLNLVAHKVAPALAVGASIILKPAPQAPRAAYLLKSVFDQAVQSKKELSGIPLDSFQVFEAQNEVIAKLFEDSRLPTLSFTGSDAVGWMLKSKAPKKKVCLELGGNAAVIVHQDADIKRAALRCAQGAFAYAGQVCISVQRIFVQKDVYPIFMELFIEETKKLKVGDPEQADTWVGPVIDGAAAKKIISWCKEAQNSGAKLIYGKFPDQMEITDTLIDPLVFIDCPETAKIFTEEVFGPVVLVNKYESAKDAARMVNSSRFGLQAGLFTDSSRVMEFMISALDVGGLVINDAPTFRADGMPYGGVKESGEGREGLRFAMEEFCERKTIVKWLGASQE